MRKQALFEYLFPVGNKQQTTGFARILFLECLIVQCRNCYFSCAGCGNNEIAGITADSSLGFQLIRDFLLIRVWPDNHGVHFRVIAVVILFCLQRVGNTP